MKRTPLMIGRGRTALRRLRTPVSNRARVTGLSVAGIAATIALFATLVVPLSPAQAIEYPTWEDLQSAKANTSSGAAKVIEIQGLIAGLQTQVEQTRAEAEARGIALEVAQDKYDDATRRASDLQAQADASAAVADAATRQAGQLAAQLYRTGGTDLSVNLFLDGASSGSSTANGSTDGGADALLSKLGNMSKLVERSTGVYEEAQSAQNNAQALGDSAKEAQAERETLRIAAEGAMVAAQAAADAATAALAESEAKGIELAAQLAFLQDAEATVSADYEAGVIERARIEAARVEAERVARVAAAEAARVAARVAAAAAAAARPPSRSGGGSAGSAGGSPASAGGSPASAGLGGGYTSDSGWGVPASGRITGGYGPRSVICGGGSCSGGYHYGTDLGTGCNAPIYAASSGTVTYAGNLGTYGNFVKIDHGNGVSTGYAHIVAGGIYVRAGQQVSVGQNIASSGSTGASTACHLHFEVWLGGTRSNAVPFMAARGAGLG